MPRLGTKHGGEGSSTTSQPGRATHCSQLRLLQLLPLPNRCVRLAVAQLHALLTLQCLGLQYCGLQTGCSKPSSASPESSVVWPALSFPAAAMQVQSWLWPHPVAWSFWDQVPGEPATWAGAQAWGQPRHLRPAMPSGLGRGGRRPCQHAHC